MTAVYPLAIKTFTTKHDQVDTVLAAHVNDLQSEVVAMQQILGLIPNQDPALVMKTNRWSTVADRLDSIQRGHGKPAWYLTHPGAVPCSRNANVVVPFGRPGADFDPEGYFNGTGVTVKREGWYSISGGGYFAQSNAPGGREWELRVDGWPAAVSTKNDVGIPLWFNLHWEGPLRKGAVLNTMLHQSTSGTLSGANIFFSGHFIREHP